MHAIRYAISCRWSPLPTISRHRRGPAPVDTTLVNRQSEVDQGTGLVTEPGASWRVFWASADERYLGCDASGALIICTVAELQDRFYATGGRA